MPALVGSALVGSSIRPVRRFGSCACYCLRLKVTKIYKGNSLEGKTKPRIVAGLGSEASLDWVRSCGHFSHSIFTLPWFKK